jgi:MSHA biogenesis protein MshQ
VAYFCLATSDVGKYSVSLRDDSATPVLGSSSTLTARPFAVAVKDMTGNPANNTASDSVFTTAGTSFPASMQAYLWASTGSGIAGSGDANGDGLPDVASTLAQLSNGGVVLHYADTVTLAAAAPFAPVVPSGTAGSLGNGTVAVTGGSATVTNLNYSEVGTFTLTASPATSYLSTSGVDLSGRVAIFAGPSNARTPLVGRFKPHHFDLSGGAIVNRSDVGAGAGCSPASTFTYMGEPMGVSFTLTPRNAAGATTTNYRDFGSGVDYSKFPTSKTTTANWTALGSADSVGLWMNATGHAVSPGSCTVVMSNATPSVTSYACTAGVTTPTAVSRTVGPRVTIAAPSIGWSSGGVGSFTANATLERADTLDGPYSALNIGIAPQDSDGVQLLPAAIVMDADNSGSSERAAVGATSVRNGRLQLQNAYGSELLDLPVPLFSQYWNGSVWVKNSDDSCTPVIAPTSGAGLTFYLEVPTVRGNHLSATETTASVNATGKLVLGDAGLKFSKPGTDNTGYVDITIPLASQPWLQFPWKGAGNVDPSARATFGIYKSPLIYRRENY